MPIRYQVSKFTETPKNRTDMHNVPIRDPERIQALFRDLRDQHGGESAAAKVLGISQSTFSRLLSGASSGVMSRRTRDSIVKGLGGEPRLPGRPRRPIEFAVGVEHLDSSERAALETRVHREYERRKREQGEGAERPKPQAVLDAEASAGAFQLQRFLEAIGDDDEEYHRSHYEAWMARELEHLKPLAEPVLRELWGDRRMRRRIGDFLERVDRARNELPTDNDCRCWLALCRAVEPLVTAPAATWGIERSWEDLRDKDELRDYMKAALKREELMLKPTCDADRVKRARPPTGYWESMEQMAVEQALSAGNPPPPTWEGWDALLGVEEGGE